MRCPLCGTEGTDKYCSNCGRLLKCQACGAFSDGNFCVSCGKPMTQEALSFKFKHSVKNFGNKNTFYYYGAAFFIILIAFAFYLLTPSEIDSTSNKLGKAAVPIDIPAQQASTSGEKASQENTDYAILKEGSSLIEQNKFEEAFQKLKSIPEKSEYYPDAQAQIDELLIPLAEARLKDAKRLFEGKQYQTAYETLQQAYGTSTPPPEEILNLLPLYEKMATGQITNDSNPLNITVTPNSSNSQFTNSANWTKAPNNTTSVDWLAMSESQKLNIVQTVLITWNNAGKKILKDGPWFVSSVDSFYKSGNEQYMLDKAMDIVAVGGMAIENN